MSNKILVHFEEAPCKKELEQLNDNVRRLNKGKLLCADITNGEVNELNFGAVKEWLKKQCPTFTNIPAIANLLDKKEQFSDLSVINGLKDSIESEYITINAEGFYEVTKENQTKLKDKHTTYLKPEKVKAYKTLDKVVKALQTVSLEELQALQKDYTGRYSLNKYRLNTVLK